MRHRLMRSWAAMIFHAACAFTPPQGVPTRNAPTSEFLDCRIKGFYPFPCGPEVHGPFAWLFRDTHQAVAVKCGSDRLFADFMTAGGQSHPVWWDEAVKWHVLLGGQIAGEVRVKDSGTCGVPGDKMSRLRAFLAEYPEGMQLYTANCRVFACRVQRECERLNAEDDADAGSTRAALRALSADVRLAAGVLRAGALPAAYPLGTLLLCWGGLENL